MTQEEKQLLIIDLCTRLPRGVKICVDGYICTLLDINTEMGDKLNGETFHTVGFNKPDGNYDFCAVSKIKPYLRPMSSMTEEERLYFHRNSARVQILVDKEKIITKPFYGYTIHLFDWLNTHHFDYRNLISMGLALEAPEGMYKTEWIW